MRGAVGRALRGAVGRGDDAHDASRQGRDDRRRERLDDEHPVSVAAVEVRLHRAGIVVADAVEKARAGVEQEVGRHLRRGLVHRVLGRGSRVDPFEQHRPELDQDRELGPEELCFARGQPGDEIFEVAHGLLEQSSQAPALFVDRAGRASRHRIAGPYDRAPDRDAVDHRQAGFGPSLEGHGRDLTPPAGSGEPRGDVGAGCAAKELIRTAGVVRRPHRRVAPTLRPIRGLFMLWPSLHNFLFERAMRALWQRAHARLGEAIVDQVLYTASEKYPVVATLKIEPAGVPFDAFHAPGAALGGELPEVVCFVLAEFLTVIGNLTDEILTPALYAELARERPRARCRGRDRAYL